MSDVDMRQVDLAFSAQAEVESLEVTGELFGASHRFEHEGQKVEIRVPAVTLDEKLQPIEKHRRLAEFRSGWAVNPTRETNSYAIGHLETSIALLDPMLIPKAMLDVPPKRTDIAGPILSEELDELSIECEGHLASAVAHWKAVVRWITGSRAIDTPGGLPGRQAEAAFQFQALVSLPDHKRLWMPTAVLALQRPTKLNAEAWTRIGAVLKAGHDVPIWSLFLDQAFRYLQQWDATGCVLTCAIACETLAKQINALSPTNADGTPNANSVRTRPRMATIIGNWEALTGYSDKDARTIEIRELVKIRNDLMHSGGIKLNPDHARAQRLYDAAINFVRLGEDLFYSKRGEINPRHLLV